MTSYPPPSPWQRPQPPGPPTPSPGYGPTGVPYPPPFPPPRPARSATPGTPPLAPHVAGYQQWARQRRRRVRLGLWLGVGATLVFLLGMAVLLLAALSTTVLDNTAVANGVRTILTTKYGLTDHDVQNVTCPPNQPLEPGHRFTCTAVITGKPTAITVTVRTEAGEYEVARP